MLDFFYSPDFSGGLLEASFTFFWLSIAVVSFLGIRMPSSDIGTPSSSASSFACLIRSSLFFDTLDMYLLILELLVLIP